MPDGTEGYEGTQDGGFRPAVNRIFWTGDAGLAASLDDMIAWERHIDAVRDDATALATRIAAPVSFADGNPAFYDGSELLNYGTSPTLADTDGDGRSDFQEVNQDSTNALLADLPTPELQLVGTVDLGLDIQLSTGATQTNAITRYNVTGHVDYTLRLAADDSVLISGTVQNFTSYSASGTVVSTAAAERDAYVRLMRLLADEIVTDMIAKSSALANP